MAYADQQGMTTSRMVAIGLVIVLHALLGYGLITGLAYEAVKKVKERLEVQEITEDEPPPEEEPPPEPEPIQELEPPPVEVFKPPVTTNNTTNTKPPPPDTPPPPPTKQCPDGRTVLRTASCEPDDPVVNCPGNTLAPGGGKQVKRSQLSSCRAPEPDRSKKAEPRNNRGRWVTTNDYPSRSLNRGEEGTSRITLTIGTNGRVTNCTASGASDALNKAACKNASRRARFRPALDKRGNPTTGTFSTSVRWQIPK